MRKINCFVLYVFFACTNLLQGAVFPLIDPVTGQHSGWEMIASPRLAELGEVSVPYVYHVSSDSVVMQLDKTFSRPPQEMYFDPLIIEFHKISSNAVKNIVIEDEYVVNDTGKEWLDFHMYLMVSTFNPQAGFNPNFIPDGSQLEKVYYGANYGYNGLPIQLHFVNNSGSGVPSFPLGDNVFQPGYLSGKIVIVTNPDMAVGARFGLKEIPTIPEPVTVLLLGLGGLMLRRNTKDKDNRNLP